MSDSWPAVIFPEPGLLHYMAVEPFEVDGIEYNPLRAGWNRVPMIRLKDDEDGGAMYRSSAEKFEKLRRLPAWQDVEWDPALVL